MDLTRVGTSTEKSTRMFLTAEQADIFKVTTAEGFELRATEWHKMYVERDGNLVKIPLNEVEPGDKLLVQSDEGGFGIQHNPDLAYLAGVIAAEGTFIESETRAGNPTSTARVYLYGDKRVFAGAIENAAAKALVGMEHLVERQSTLAPTFTESILHRRSTLHSAPLAKVLAENGMTQATKTALPQFVLQGDRDTQVAYVSGLFQMDGTITGSASAQNLSIELGSVDRSHLVGVQRL